LALDPIRAPREWQFLGFANSTLVPIASAG
jgi:hypothetical protein